MKKLLIFSLNLAKQKICEQHSFLKWNQNRLQRDRLSHAKRNTALLYCTISFVIIALQISKERLHNVPEKGSIV